MQLRYWIMTSCKIFPLGLTYSHLPKGIMTNNLADVKTQSATKRGQGVSVVSIYPFLETWPFSSLFILALTWPQPQPPVQKNTRQLKFVVTLAGYLFDAGWWQNKISPESTQKWSDWWITWVFAVRGKRCSFLKRSDVALRRSSVIKLLNMNQLSSPSDNNFKYIHSTLSEINNVMILSS